MIDIYHGLRCEDIMFEGQVDSVKRINLLYDDVERLILLLPRLESNFVKHATNCVQVRSQSLRTDM